MLTIEQVKEKYIQNIIEKDAPIYQKLIENSLPIEKIAVDEIKNSIIDQTVGLPKLDLSFLSMADEQGWPRFAVFHVCNPVCKLEVSRRGGIFNGRRLSHHPWQIFDRYYDKFLNRLYKKSYSRNHHCSIETTFNGLIPVEIRNKIQQNVEKFRVSSWRANTDYIFIIAESTGWSYKSKYVPPPVKVVDPLVIGIKNNVAYLIDSFDLMPVEEMVKREFST